MFKIRHHGGIFRGLVICALSALAGSGRCRLQYLLISIRNSSACCTQLCYSFAYLKGLSKGGGDPCFTALLSFTSDVDMLKNSSRRDLFGSPWQSA
jgi:hypothetical protein